MKKEIVMNVNPLESRVALLEDSQLVEIFIDRLDSRRIVNNIYKGRVQKVLPGLQSAFIDIGLEKAGFMHISDLIKTQHLFAESLDEEDNAGFRRQGRGRDLKIENLVKEREEIMVQVLKEPVSTKGPKISTTISLTGRFMVLVPGTNFIGVSKKTRDWQERKRIKRIIQALKPANLGVIVRTHGLGKTDAELYEELQALVKKWEAINQAFGRAVAPALLHQEAGTHATTIRDFFSEQVERVVIDDRETFKEVANDVLNSTPELLPRIFLYKGEEPLFEAYGIEKELKRSTRRKVWLPSGGYLVFDYTEAMVVIDVNTGRNVGKRNFEDTLLATNLEAAREIARQCRLRDLGGIIVIDFIDMRDERNRSKVCREFQRSLLADRSRTKLSSISEFGLLQMTRKSVRPNIINLHTETCYACEGSGRVTSKATLAADIVRGLARAWHRLHLKKAVIEVSVQLADFLLENQKDVLKNVQQATNVQLELREIRTLPQDQFRILHPKTQEDLTERLLE